MDSLLSLQLSDVLELRFGLIHNAQIVVLLKDFNLQVAGSYQVREERLQTPGGVISYKPALLLTSIHHYSLCECQSELRFPVVACAFNFAHPFSIKNILSLPSTSSIRKHNTPPPPQTSTAHCPNRAMPAYKSVLTFMVRRLAAEDRASETKIQEQIELTRRKVQSTESLAPVRPETLEYII